MLVSFIVVAYNAGEKIINLINDIKKQEYDHEKIQIILVDGISDDHTKQIMQNFAKSNHDFFSICVLDNPKKILPCGWNIALKEALGDIILRVDAHSSIPVNFISKNVECIKNGEKIVGGHRSSVIDEKNSWQKTLLIAEKSIFGSGIAAYRRIEQKKYVNTLAHAAYAREVFKKVGGYDERLARTEDNEIHYRMKKMGYKFFFNPEIKSFHHARNTLSKMMKQKYLNGYWIGLTLGVSPFCFSIYHFVPLMFVLTMIFFTFLSINGYTLPIVILLSMYSFVAVCITIMAMVDRKQCVSFISLPLILFILHCCYGIGSLLGLIEMPLWVLKKENRDCREIYNVKKLYNEIKV